MNYKIDRIDIQKDGNKVLDFWSTNFPRWPKEKYSWFYVNNPSGNAACWLVSIENEGKTIGTRALFPRTMYINNEKKLAGIAGDFAFAEQHRTFWPAFMLQKKVLSSVKDTPFDFIYGSPNKQADQLMGKVGYNIIGSSVYYVKKIRSYSYLKARLKNKHITRILSVIVDVALFLISPETYKAVFIRNRVFQPNTSFDERFDRLWEKSVGNYAIIGVRNSQFLNWRFCECPYIEYKICSLTGNRAADVYGYIVYKIIDKELLIADLFLVDIDKYFDELMVMFLKYVRKLKINSVIFTFFGLEKLKRKMKKYHFFDRKKPRSFIIYTDKNTIEKYHLNDPDKWYFMECDNDI